MKKGVLFSLFAILSMVVYGQFFKTQAHIVVVNDLGNVEAEVSVTLYTTEEDYNNNKPAVPMQKTDKKGRVRFSDLEPVSYFIEAKKGTKSNTFHGEKTEVLDKGKVNKFHIVISG